MTNMLSSVYLTLAIITLSVIINKASSSKKTMIEVRDLVHRMFKIIQYALYQNIYGECRKSPSLS